MQHIELPAPLGSWPTIGGADDGDEEVSTEDEATEDEESEETADLEDEVDEGEDIEESADGSTVQDPGTEDGGGDEEDEKSSESSAKPTGADLLALLAEDPDAQTLMSNALRAMQEQQAIDAQTEAERAAFQKLVDADDFEGVGKAVLEKQRRDAARSTVQDEILKEQFTPEYQAIFASPAMQKLTPEEKEGLAPKNFKSDAAWLRHLSGFEATKRVEATIEAKAQARAKEIIEATKNGTTAQKASVRSVSGGPPPRTSGSVTDFMKRSSGSILAEAFSGMLGGGETEAED